MTSSMVSPATNRVVSFWKNLNRAAKSLRPSCPDNQISALLVTIESVFLKPLSKVLVQSVQENTDILRCAILGGFFSNPRRNNCTPPAEQGTALNATEAGNNRLTTRRRGGRRREYRAGIGCTGSEVALEPGTAGNFNAPAADRDNR